jgi:hypothetical protein
MPAYGDIDGWQRGLCDMSGRGLEAGRGREQIGHLHTTTPAALGEEGNNTPL